MNDKKGNYCKNIQINTEKSISFPACNPFLQDSDNDLRFLYFSG